MDFGDPLEVLKVSLETRFNKISKYFRFGINISWDDTATKSDTFTG